MYDNNVFIELLQNGQFEKVEEMSIDAIKKNYLNPQYWIFLMQALCFQGYGEDSMKVLQRASLLDPHATWIEAASNDINNHDLCKKREDIDSILSMNVKKVTVAAAMIVKDEEEFIEECILSVIDAVDEMIIVDTGSTDRTIEIINSISKIHNGKIKLTHFDWCDDFSKARNAAIPYITSDWVLWIDADARLFSEDVYKVREVAGLFENIKDPILLKVKIYHENDAGEINVDFDEIKMYSMKFNFKYKGIIHELPYLENIDLSSSMILVNLRFKHVGYKLSVIEEKKKAERNLSLLKKTVEECPEDPLGWFFYGRELYCENMTDEAIKALKRAESLNISSKGLRIDIYLHLIKAHMEKNDYNNAEIYCLKSMKVYENFPDILFYYAIIQMNKGYALFNIAQDNLIKAKAEFNNSQNPIAPHSSIYSWKADYYLADIYKVQGNFTKYREILEQLKVNSPVKNEIEVLLKNLV